MLFNCKFINLSTSIRIAMKSFCIALILLFIPFNQIFPQVAINNDGSAPNSSAMLDVKSTEKGLLIPRMSYSAIYAIQNPAQGLMVFCVDCGYNCEGLLVIYTDGRWSILSPNCLYPKAPLAATHTPGLTQITWVWYAVAGAEGYKWNTVDNPSTAIDLGTNLTYVETGLLPNTEYTRYIWAYNDCGNSPSNAITSQTLPFWVGASYGGGIIFYLDGSGNHGLISATSDQSTGAQWGCFETLLGGTSTALGSGQENTTFIVTNCLQPGIAADICDDLVLNGYSDWFLPSRDELYQMYLQRSLIGNFTTSSYYSSSECDAYSAWSISFNGGSQNCSLKNLNRRVRAVREF